MKNHQKELEKLGQNINHIDYPKIFVGSSTNNLKEAIKKEANEKRFVYREFAQDAKDEGMYKLVEKFKAAKKTETNHEYFLKRALYNLDKNLPENYYVSNQTGRIESSCQCIANCKCEAPPKAEKGDSFSKY